MSVDEIGCGEAPGEGSPERLRVEPLPETAHHEAGPEASAAKGLFPHEQRLSIGDGVARARADEPASLADAQHAGVGHVEGERVSHRARPYACRCWSRCSST